MANKDIRRLIRELERQGWRVERRKHFVCFPPDKTKPPVVAASSDRRSLPNAVALLRWSGLGREGDSMDWTVYVEVRTAAPLTMAQADALVDHLAGHHTGGVALLPEGWSTTVTVTAARAALAAQAVERIITAFPAIADLAPATGPVTALEVLDEATAETRGTARPFPELAGLHEVAELVGVSKTRIRQITTDNPAAPAPVAQLASGPVWQRDDWSWFLETWERRPGRPPKNPTAS